MPADRCKPFIMVLLLLDDFKIIESSDFQKFPVPLFKFGGRIDIAVGEKKHRKPAFTEKTFD